MLHPICAGALLMPATTAVHGTYVTDRLTAGLHEDPAQTKRPFRVVQAGTPAEPLRRTGLLAGAGTALGFLGGLAVGLFRAHG